MINVPTERNPHRLFGAVPDNYHMLGYYHGKTFQEKQIELV